MVTVFLDAATLGNDITFDKVRDVSDLVIHQVTEAEQIAERIEDADIVVVNKIKLNESNLRTAVNLKLICVAATGYDNIDISYCRTRNIAVCNVLGYSTNSVAQLTVGLVLNLLMHLPIYADFVQSGAYSASGIANRLEPIFHELAGKTWGIVGAGNIGGKVASIADAFGCNVQVYRRKFDPIYKTVDIDTLCRTSDVISIHTPLSEETRGLISADRLAIMKKDVILVNTARGAVVDEAALAEAILSDRIGGFGSDVYSIEPLPESHPLYQIRTHRNVIMTPHMAWGAYESRQRCIDEIAMNIASYLTGGTRCRADFITE